MKFFRLSSIVFFIFLILILGCAKKEKCITTIEYNNLLSYQTKYEQCNVEFEDYKSNTAKEINKYREDIFKKDYLINDVIKWNETIYNSTWNMSYVQTTKATKDAKLGIFWTIILNLIAGLVLAIFGKLFSEKTKKVILWLALILTCIALVITMYILSMHGVKIFQYS